MATIYHMRAGFLLTMALIAASSLSYPDIARAEEALAAKAASPPRFDIQRFEVEGNSLLATSDIDRLMVPFIGSSRDFGDVQRALEALQDAYRKQGYGAVEVFLPEQELEAGIVRLRVIEQKVASVSVDGNQHFDAENVRNSVPALQVGATPNIREIGRSLRVANENPAKQTAVIFKNTTADDHSVDATLKVVDDKPWKGFLTLDNTGSRETGHSRIGIGFQHYNLFNRDDRVTAQFITTLHYPDQFLRGVRIFGLGYTIPLYQLGDSVDFLAGYSDVDSGKVQNLFNVTGKGLILGAHYNHNFAKINNYQHKVTLALDQRSYRSDVLFSSLNITPHVTATPVSATYAGLWQSEQQQVSFNFAAIQNIPMAAHGDDGDFSQSPYLANDDFTKYNYGFDYSRQIAKDWQIHLAGNGQATKDHMIPGEQFRIGGMDSVRGWHESVISGDKGYRWSVEAISPDFGDKIGDKIGARGLLFFDKGHVSNAKNILHQSTTNPDINIASVGAGLRFNYGKEIVGRMDYAVVVDGDMYANPAGGKTGSREKGDQFMHISLGYMW